MKKTLTLFAIAALAMSTAFAQNHHGAKVLPQAASVKSPAESLIFGQQLKSQAKHHDRLTRYASDDDYESYTYTYNAQGQVGCIYTEQGYDFDRTMLYDSIKYDAQGHLVRIDGWQWLENQWKNVYYIEYTYNDQDLVATRKNYNFYLGHFELGGTYYYYYNAAGQITLSKLDFAGGWFDSTRYEYTDGKLTRRYYAFIFNPSFPSGQVTHYYYDNQGHLTQAVDSVSDDLNYWEFDGRQDYTYDADGNVTVFSDKDAGLRERQRREYEFESRLLADTYVPHTPEHEDPKTYNNKNTYHTEHFYSVDDNYVLQYICDYFYEYGDFSSIENASAANLSVYPNPATDRLVVAGEQGDRLVRIFDLGGRCVKMQRMENSDVTIDLTSLQAGTYVVRVDGANTRTAKVVVR